MKTKLLLVVFSIAFLSCKKTKNLDCSSSSPFKADFQVGEFINGFGFVPGDTIISFSLATKTSRPYTSYQWTIGNDPRIFTGASASLNFSAAQAGETFPVKLTASGKSEGCYSGADQSNIVVKKVTVMYPRGFKHENLFTSSQLVTLPFLGKWQGSFTDNPSDTFTIHIVNNGPLPASGTTNSYGIRIYNLPKGCSGNPINGTCGFITPTEQYYGYPLEVAFRYFYSDDSGFGTCCPKAKLDGGIDPNDHNKITINCRFYTVVNNTLTETKKTFIAFRR